MIKGTRQSPAYTTYTFTEEEFKRLLGIEADPDGVLTVETDFAALTLTVTMDGTGG